jgi:3'-phosphoadenosine 5'-phosphosulfate sulfotransferase (PAPS reductase)/FAD synthetase
MILQFSGGKDSLVVLHMYRDKIKQVLFSDTGSVFPHMLEFIEKTCKEYNLPLTIVRPPVDVEEHTEANGLPTDILPVGFRDVGLQSVLDCCNAMLWVPMQHHVLTSEWKIVLRGQKKGDLVKTPGAEFDWNGIKFLNPSGNGPMTMFLHT